MYMCVCIYIYTYARVYSHRLRPITLFSRPIFPWRMPKPQTSQVQGARVSHM